MFSGVGFVFSGVGRGGVIGRNLGGGINLGKDFIVRVCVGEVGRYWGRG